MLIFVSSNHSQKASTYLFKRFLDFVKTNALKITAVVGVAPIIPPFIDIELLTINSSGKYASQLGM